MARKRFSEEDILGLLRQIELGLASGSDVPSACRSVGVSTATYYSWRRRYGLPWASRTMLKSRYSNVMQKRPNMYS